MSLNQLKKILKNHSHSLSFLIGNGVNNYVHHLNNNSSLKWDQLLLRLWNNHSSTHKKEIPSGISFTEFYDILEFQNSSKSRFSKDLQLTVIRELNSWEPDKIHNTLFRYIQKLDRPILTTNYDQQIARTLSLSFRKLTPAGFSDFYPWSCYYSNKPIQAKNIGFSVWHPNGMTKYQRSIKLGLAQYMGNVHKARNLIYDRSNGLYHPKRKTWIGTGTWLDLFFHQSLFIFGLALEENEIFFRWLLIERAKYYKKYPSRSQLGWYITTQNEINEGKTFFLESVGIQTINLSSYTELYEDLWR